MDLNQLATAIATLCSATASPEARKEADTALTQWKDTTPTAYIHGLIEIIKASADPLVRQQAAVLCRGPFRDPSGGKSVWSDLLPEAQTTIKNQLILMIFSEQSPPVKKALGDLIQGIASSETEWPELQECILRLITDSDVENRVVGLNLLSDLTYVFEHYINNQMMTISNLVDQQVATGNPRVIEAAYGLVLNIIADISEDDCQPLQRFTSDILRVICGPDRVVAEGLLKKFIAAMEISCDFFKADFPRIFEALFPLVENRNENSSLASLALELMMVVVDSKPRQVQKMHSGAVMNKLVLTLMKILYENLDDGCGELENLVSSPPASAIPPPTESLPVDYDWLTKDEALEDEGTDDVLFGMAEFNMDTIAASIGGEYVLPIIFAEIGRLLEGNATARAKIVAMISICQTVEYLPKAQLTESLTQIVDLIMRFLEDPNYRVRFAALKSLGQTALDHLNKIQEEHLDRILPGIMARMEDPIPRTQAQAFLAFVNLVEGTDFEQLAPYVQECMSKIVRRLDPAFATASVIPALSSQGWGVAGVQPPDAMPVRGLVTPDGVAVMYRKIQESSITAAAVVAAVLGPQFLPYSQQILHILKDIAATASSDSLRGRAIECLCLIVSSVAPHPGTPAANLPHPLREEAVQIIMALINLYKQSDEKADILEYVYPALRRMIKTVGDEFKAFLPTLLEILLPHLKIKKHNIEDGDDYIICFSENRSYIKCSSYYIMQVERDLAILINLVSACGKDFAPYAQTFMEALDPLIMAILTGDIRRLSLTALGEILKVCKMANPEDPYTIPRTWIVKSIDIALASSKTGGVDDDDYSTAEVLMPGVLGLAKLIETAGEGVLTDHYLRCLTERLFVIWKASSKRRIDLESKEGQGDEEEQEARAESAEFEETFSEAVLMLFHAVLSTHSSQFLSIAGDITGQFIEFFLAPKSYPTDQALALCVCAALLQHVGAPARDALAPKLPGIFEMVHHPESVIRAAACNVFVLYAGLPTTDNSLIAPTVGKLVRLIDDPSGVDAPEVTDNAVGGLFQVVMNHADKLDEATVLQLVQKIFEKLPLQEEEDLGLLLYKHLFTSLQNPASVFWGPSQSNIPHVVKLVGNIYRIATDPETDTLIREVTRKIPNLAGVISTINLLPEEKWGLKRLERDLA